MEHNERELIGQYAGKWGTTTYPCENAAAIDLLSENASVEIYAEYNSWLLVKTQNKLGWVKAEAG